jgi:alkylation response protein AidB-like acyl-CoA dehydrogenase
VDFRLGEEDAAFRENVRVFLREQVTPEVRDRVHRTGTHHDWDLHRKIAAMGWLNAHWPTEAGGQGRGPLAMMAFHEELALADAPTDGMGITMLVTDVIRAVGTPEQRQFFLPPVVSGDCLFCLGYTEPDAGSDVAAVVTRAVREGDDWVVNGQKMFTTLAHEANFVFLLTRTNSEVPQHRGLTMFLVPMDAPGIEIQPVHTVGGERTNVTFYTDVRVSDSMRVGEVDGGWDVMRVALAFERGGAMGSELQRHLRRAVEWASHASDEHDDRPMDEPEVRATLARVAIRAEVGRLLNLRTIDDSAQNGVPNHVFGSMAKVYLTEALVHSVSELLDRLGAEGVLQHGDPAAPADGWLEAAFRHVPVTTIYGGTSEVQRSIIAERGLGLPRIR